MSNCSVTGSINGNSPNLTSAEATATMDSLYDGLPAGTFYYTGDHLGSSSLVTNANGDEVLRIAYDSYGAVDLTQSGRLDNGTLTLATNQAEYGILAVRFTGQEYDARHGCLSVGGRRDALEPTPETGLYYYNARYYDDRHGCLSVGVRMDAQEPTPQLVIFTTADNLVPYDKGDLNLTLYPNRDLLNRKKSDGKSKQIMQTGNMDMHRYMYVRGNPVKYTDPGGHEPYLPNIMIGASLAWLFSFPTQPPWHRFTGMSRRTEFDSQPMTWLDGIAKSHDDMNANLALEVLKRTPQERGDNIKADAFFIGEYALTAPFSFFVNFGRADDRYKEWFGTNYMDKIGSNPIYFLGFMVFMLAETLFQTAVDLGVGMLGVGLFSANLALYTSVHIIERTGAVISDMFNGNLAHDFQKTVGPMKLASFKNIDNPSKWRVPEGEGRFKNWNKPWEWRL